ncbi:hypothetical protein QBC46DRAFT_263966 [Diplogelasinospora grovesii]|uniref:Ubiquitin carboxyl-terminal hydrolase n=1 Tax=Diplogelasinospora grovesii TaxID=303347 RepID=A0AAN6S420_9PEZI|nr:hypothetical protein QBC46DRAFT_263966 [Diplogelasinospora grovesii]
MSSSTTVVNHSGPAPPSNGQGSFAFGSGGGGPGGARKGGKRPLPHIDDITSVTADVDPNSPIDTLLQHAETCFAQAESSKSFGRPDIGLKEYIRTNIIVLETIKKNKDWPSLQGHHASQFDRYQNLLRRVHAVHGEFDKIKAAIKADNARTGVQPTSRRQGVNGEAVGKRAETRIGGAAAPNGTPNGVNAHHRSQSSFTVVKENGAPKGPAPPAPKGKPAVHPKPQALHGNVLKHGGEGQVAASTSRDLHRRLANLRSGPTSAAQQPQQDPRIRTQSITPLPASEPQSVPAPQPPAVPPPLPPKILPAEMPRLPDAIYSPARGTVSSEAAELPSSTPRGMFTRTNSRNSFTGTSRNSKPVSSDPYSSPLSPSLASASGLPKRTKPKIPDGNTLSAQELSQFMKEISVLLIDIRNREDFDDGHIMSQATICVEADVLAREHISANDIADSMVLAPAAEKLLFEKRHDFDLIVFYDQLSSRITSSPMTNEERAILGLFNALSLYDFSGASAKQLKLLQGGLDAWIDLIGRGGLQTSSTTSKIPNTTALGQTLLGRRRKYVSRPIQDPEEAKRWEDTIADIGAVSPVRTTEDFLRRFPAISGPQESMLSPVGPRASQDMGSYPYRLSQDETALYSSLPSPPTRPPPTVPRKSYSGLADNDNSSAAMVKKLSLQSGTDQPRKHRTGFINPGVWCFANSSLQAMFATPGFSRELWSGEWKDLYQVPLKPDESLRNPQILAKILGTLFSWLNQGTLGTLEAKTLMDYVRSTHEKTADGTQKPDSEVFGGPCQQDAQEYYQFLTDNLHDETNVRRDKKQPPEKTYTREDGTVIQNAVDYWSAYSTASASIIDKYFRGLMVFIDTCQSCHRETRSFQPSDVWILSLAGASDPTDLDALLSKHQAPETFPELKCEKCKEPGRTRRIKFGRMPDRLAFCFNRFQQHSLRRNASSKIHTKVRFPIRDLDLTRYMAQPNPDVFDETSSEIKDAHFVGGMRYDCYAVTVHTGQGINGGHYYAYVQDELSKDPTDWFKCNDDSVTRVKIGTGRDGDVATEHMYQHGPASAYMVYYRRQGA